MSEERNIKVGLIACSGEELAEGTLTRTAVRFVLEKLRPEKTVTICLPLFLAGESGERNFAKSYPTIAVDGCGKLCAKVGTEKYSGKVDGVVNVEELLKGWGVTPPSSRRALDDDGVKLAWRIAEEIASRVDAILDNCARVPETLEEKAQGEPVCSCMAGAMKKTPVRVGETSLELAAIEPLFNFMEGLPELPPDEVRRELVHQIKLYNGPLDEVPESALANALYDLFQARAHRSGT